MGVPRERGGGGVEKYDVRCIFQTGRGVLRELLALHSSTRVCMQALLI